MTDIVFDPYLFLRTPALSYEDYNEAALIKILDTDFFRSAIFFASESLYEALAAKQFNYHLLDEKVKFSLQKYFNRMCFRPTPFGMFSAFSSLAWSDSYDEPKTVLQDAHKVHINPDFQFTTELARKMERSGKFTDVRYFPNNSIYAIKGEKRYLTDRFDEKRKKTEYFVNSFEGNRVLNKLLIFSKEGKTRVDLINWLGDFVDERADAEAYVGDLIDGGLLISELYPNMTGPKYFGRVAEIAGRHQNDNEFAREILLYRQLLSELENGFAPGGHVITDSPLYSSFRGKFKSMFYVVMGKPVQGDLDKKYQDIIREGLFCLSKITGEGQPRALTNFASKFRARFEGQEVPLLLALDREAGVGYEGLEANLFNSELLEGVQLEPRSNATNFNWTPTHELFLSKLVSAKNNGPIEITAEDLKKLKDTDALKTPPSFSVIFRPYGEKVWIEQAGGCTATALLGRFSLFSEEVKAQTAHIAKVEEKTNPDVVFAEISCFNDEHAANINSNAGIRKYEIPIGVHSTYPPENVISLADLVVSVRNNRILLRSKKHSKMLVPRLSSAFNYNRSELTVFRFLCDLQSHGLKVNYGFDLRALLPGLNFYPRVEYGKCILYPATWILSQQDITEITGGPASGGFKKIAKKIGLQKYFGLTEGDNQLLFDRDDPAAIDLFIKTIRAKPHATLTEVFIDKRAQVCDQNGRAYVAQFIASLVAAAPVYIQQHEYSTSKKRGTLKRVYLPGDEWLYFKIYCHHAAANSILLDDIAKIVKRLKKQNLLKNWFFIRYADPDEHLRVRLKIDPENAAKVIRYFERQIRRPVERGSASNVIMDTYKREIERYGEKTMEYAEQVFNASSNLIINFLGSPRKRMTALSEFHFAIVSVDVLLDAYFHENSKKTEVSRLLYEGMRKEFDDSKQLKVQMDSKYREYAAVFNNLQKIRPAVVSVAGKSQFENYTYVLNTLHTVYPGIRHGTLTRLAGDLIHMHLNRLFSDRQRGHEFVIYYLLQKYYASVEARRNKSGLTFSHTFKGFGMDEVEEFVLK